MPSIVPFVPVLYIVQGTAAIASMKSFTMDVLKSMSITTSCFHKCPRLDVQIASALVPQLGSVALSYLQQTPRYLPKQILLSRVDLMQEFLLRLPCRPFLALYNLGQLHQWRIIGVIIESSPVAPTPYFEHRVQRSRLRNNCDNLCWKIEGERNVFRDVVLPRNRVLPIGLATIENKSSIRHQKHAARPDAPTNIQSSIMDSMVDSV